MVQLWESNWDDFAVCQNLQFSCPLLIGNHVSMARLFSSQSLLPAQQTLVLNSHRTTDASFPPSYDPISHLLSQTGYTRNISYPVQTEQHKWTWFALWENWGIVPRWEQWAGTLESLARQVASWFILNSFTSLYTPLHGAMDPGLQGTRSTEQNQLRVIQQHRELWQCRWVIQPCSWSMQLLQECRSLMTSTPPLQAFARSRDLPTCSVKHLPCQTWAMALSDFTGVFSEQNTLQGSSCTPALPSLTLQPPGHKPSSHCSLTLVKSGAKVTQCCSTELVSLDSR